METASKQMGLGWEGKSWTGFRPRKVLGLGYFQSADLGPSTDESGVVRIIKAEYVSQKWRAVGWRAQVLNSSQGTFLPQQHYFEDLKAQANQLSAVVVGMGVQTETPQKGKLPRSFRVLRECGKSTWGLLRPQESVLLSSQEQRLVGLCQAPLGSPSPTPSPSWSAEGLPPQG